MKGLFWAGLMVVLLGIVSFLVSVPNRERHGGSVGGASVGIETESSEKLPPYVSAILIAGGIGMMVMGGKGRQ